MLILFGAASCSQALSSKAEGSEGISLIKLEELSRGVWTFEIHAGETIYKPRDSRNGIAKEFFFTSGDDAMKAAEWMAQKIAAEGKAGDNISLKRYTDSARIKITW